MPPIPVVISLAILLFSLFGGLLFYYLVSPHPKTVKKEQIDKMTSYLINFVIYMWIGKIIVNFSTFIRDPLAILAFPSNSLAFYIANVFIIINIIYSYFRHKLDVKLLFHSFIPVFLAATFLYEFFQIVVEGNRSGWLYLSFVTLLIILFISMLEKFPLNKNIILITFIWLIGKLVLSIIYTYTTIFGYMITPIYFIILLLLSSILLFSRRLGKVL